MARSVAPGADTTGLPDGQYWGRSCPHGHGAEEGRTPRYAANGSCVACQRARSQTMSAERKAKRAAAQRARRAAAPKRARPRKRGTRPFDRTDIPCAKPGCHQTLTVAARDGRSPYCSRICAGFGGAGMKDEDVADAALQEIPS